MSEIFNEILHEWVDIPEDPKRIASLSPSITEILVELGRIEELVGVSCWCKPYLKGTKKPVFASVYKANYERLEEIKPDIILTTSGVHRNLALELHSKGYKVSPAPFPNNLFGIINNVLVIGTLVDRQREAYELVTKLSTELEKVRADVGYGRGPRVYTEVWPQKFSTTFGGLALTNDLIHVAGGYNVFSDKAQTYFKVDFNEVTTLDPDLIVLLFANTRRIQKIDVSSLMDNRGWGNVKAVKRDKIVTASQDDLPLTHSGPSFIKTIRLLRDKFEELGFSVK
ncbi:hypothetical protein AKJ43_00345 [candidate division MSBL1 archaeon SCGC-AAA261D19]|uniref:Fe/B12 periplasmic-binding domain-containing protein n=1 Tax=candidate division MSBL1 archaeon SCGC-AAA261D19 TaxID=1698273 RepID=A0A133V8U2_9EURY|nr:hypothetical protein AKJ43_00345 [candidate division MSBL1 archaeon SCGC-AAA261D19]